jgi:ATP-dependent helicase HrpA
LREERVLQLLQRLPKELRRRLMPLKHTAAEILRTVEPAAGPFLEGMSRFLQESRGVEVPVTAWPLDALPEHLRPRFEVVGQGSQPLAAGRDLKQLCRQVREHQTPAEKRAWEEAAARWERYDLGDWDFGDLPERVVVSEASGYPLYAFPGLQHDNAQVNLRLFRTPDEAMAATQNAVPRLAERTLQREMGWLQKDLRALDRHGVFYVTLGAAGELQDTAFENLRRHLFPEPEPGIRTASSFDEYVGRAREKLPGLTARLVDWVGAILEKRQQILVCPQPFPGLRAELDALVPPQFLLRIPFERLAQLPRYLKALQVRAERASVNRVKDVEKALRVKPYTDALSQFQRSAGKDREAAELLDRLRWLVEEFKVSCFAQELGTAEPVSPRKLDALLEETRTRFGQSGRPGASS